MKLTTKFFTVINMMVVCTAFTITGCDKSTSATSDGEKVSVYLTDDAGLYNNVFIDVRYVEVKVQEGLKNEEHVGDKDDDDDDHFDDNDKDSDNDHISEDKYGKWDTLAIRPGVYDILKFKNGVDTLFAQGTTKGRIRKIRLTLGNKNSIIKGGITSPLNLHPSANNFVYIRTHNRHHETIGVNHVGFWIDFDISNSIIENNNVFLLKPLIKPFSNKQFGTVSGKVFPSDARPFVKIYNLSDSATALPEKSGEYKIRGLKEGTYKVTFSGVIGYATQAVDDIKVLKDKEIKIQDVTLRR